MKKQDAEQRETHNAEVFEVKEQEGKGKWKVGAVVAGFSLACLMGAGTILTGGVALGAAAAVSATVAATAGVTAVLTGCSQMAEADQDMAKISSVIALKTVLDVAVDYSVSKKFGLDFDPVMSGLISLGANIISSADPVNVVTGSFFLTATDMMLPELIEEEFQLQRIYNSVVL